MSAYFQGALCAERPTTPPETVGPVCCERCQEPAAEDSFCIRCGDLFCEEHLVAGPDPEERFCRKCWGQITNQHRKVA